MITYLFLFVYFAAMILIGMISARKIKTEADYYVAGKKGGVIQITGSLLATILGSSAILGTADLAQNQGWAAAWLLFCASIGLFILVPISRIINRQEKYTLPQIIGEFYGKEAKLISSLIISIAWIGIIAAQIIGAARILSGFIHLDYALGVWISGAIFIFYTLIGGQHSVLKTDLYQTIIIVLGIVWAAIFLFQSDPLPMNQLTNLNLPFNDGFHPFDLVVLLLTYSTTFVVGPDIYSRIFSANSGKTARTSVMISAIVLIPFALAVTYLGVYSAYHYPELHLQKGSALIPVMAHVLPDWSVGLMVAALLSAVMSSGSTALLTSSTIISDWVGKGLHHTKTVTYTKLILLGVGLLSILLSLQVQSIIQSLLIALTIFSGAFIIPTAAGLLGYRTTKTQSTVAMILGGLVAITGKMIALFGNVPQGNGVIMLAFVVNALILFWKLPVHRDTRK